MQLKDEKGRLLYKVILVDSTEITSPNCYVHTWEEAISCIEQLAKEIDNDSFMCKRIKYKIERDYDRANVILLCNHKGWGPDYFRIIKVEPLFYVTR